MSDAASSWPNVPAKLINDAEYVCRLLPEDVKKAREELSETPEDRLAAVKALRSWLDQQEHLRAPSDTLMLLLILRTTKYSQLAARGLLERYCLTVGELPRWYSNINPRDERVQKALGRGYIVPIPKRDENGCQIVILRAVQADIDATGDSLDLEIRCGLLSAFYFYREERTMVNGIVWVIDYSGLGLDHIKHRSLDNMRKWLRSWQGNMPGRFKAIHIYNGGAVLDTLVTMVKPFLNDKFKQRLSVHSTAESLCKALGSDHLPADYLPDDHTGGNAGNACDLAGQFQRAVMRQDFVDFMKAVTGDQVKLDKAKYNSDVTQEYFRKLETE